MKDGLYRVTTNKYVCAGFVISNGKPERVAPVLRKKFAYWCSIAVFLCGCCSDDWDCGLQANLETREEYAMFLREHPHYNPYRHWPHMFDPEKGGWYLP